MLFKKCDHDWELIVDKNMPSPIRETGMSEISGFSLLVSNWMTNKSIIICKCKKCGKLDKTITTNP